MHTIGLLGREFDECLRLLKVRIEDLGHAAIVVNLTHLPRVTRATLEFDKLIYDGYDLFDMNGFFLKEIGIREPFFHVSYARDFWTLLRERYFAFAEAEVDNVHFACSLLEILATRVPVINHPQAYSHRTLMPFHLSMLHQHGFSVPAFTTAPADGREHRTSEEQLPLSMDEERTWDSLSFPKGIERGLRLWRDKKQGMIYRLIFVGQHLLDRALGYSAQSADPSEVRLDRLAPEVRNTALKAASTIGIEFGEIMLQHSESDNRIWLMHVDPSPDFYTLEVTHGLAVSEQLAQHLVNVAAKPRTVRGSQCR